MKKISIITPSNNSERTIVQTVMSILNQTYPEFEHIIVDNKSIDNTLSEVKKLYSKSDKLERLKIISEPDKGIADAFNKGIKNATGDIIGILNADDYYFDDSVLQKVVDSFSDNKILFVHGNIYFEDKIYGSSVRKPLLCKITKALPFNHPTIFFKKEVYANYGLYNIDYKQAMDYEFFCRLERHFPDYRKTGVYLNSEPLVFMRAGGTSWENELSSLDETKMALIEYDLWNKDAKKAYYSRVFRTKVKKYFKIIGLELIVKIWRKIKWGS